MVLRFSPLIAALIVAPASGQSPAAKPKPAWAIEYADKFCALVRAPQDGAPGMIIRQRPLSTSVTFSFLTPLTGKSPKAGDTRITYGDGAPQKGLMQSADVVAQGTRVIETDVGSADLDALERTGRIRVSATSEPDIDLTLPAMTKARKALEACTADLLKSWKIERNWAVDAKAIADVRSVFTGDDYPLDLVERNQQGTVVAMLTVGADGRVSTCDVRELDGEAVFGTLTCRILRERTRFSPARDAAGKAVQSFVLSPPIRWRLAY